VANTIKVACENADELLNAGAYGSGALIHLQSSATDTGVYADLTGTGSTPTLALVAGTFSYTGYDPAGGSSTWYRSRFKNSAGTLTSDWSDPFQAAPEGAGLIASLYDFRQRLEIPYTDVTQDENLLEWLRQVTAWMVSQIGRSILPDPASGTKTYRFHTRAGSVLRLPKGIRSITTLGIATEDQPASGGTYTTATSSAYYLDPPEAERDYGWPATRVVFRSNATGSATTFCDASYGAEIVGAFGFAAIPADLASIGLTLAVSAARERGAGGGDSVTIGIGGERTFERALSFKDRLTIDWYRARAGF
jgi:hypothetical protein